MAYTPPAWNAVPLPFRGGYTPPPWNAAPLEFRPRDAGLAQAQTVSGTGAFITPGVGDTRQAQTFDGTATIRERRPVIYAQAGMLWTLGTATDREIRLPWRIAETRDHEPRIRWDASDAHDAEFCLRWATSTPRDAETRIPFSPGEPLATQTRLAWSNTQPKDIERRLPWRHARYPHAVQRGLPWVRRKANDPQRGLPWGKGTPVDHEVWLATGRAKARNPQVRLPWGMSSVPPYQYLPTPPYIPPPQPPVLPCFVPPDWNRVALRFKHANAYVPPLWGEVPLAFRCNDRIFRIARSLRMSHSLSVVRLPDRLPLRVSAVSMSTDRDSWAWSFSLRFADRASLLAVAPSPAGVVSVEITLDGYVFIALIENYTEARELASRQASASGRSRTAVLAGPYDPERAYANPAPATAQQLALRELDFSGFALDWQMGFDWTVPAGAWSYDRDTHMSAITRIAASAGGIVQAARDSDTLIVLPRYPYAPWEIAAATPDMTIEAGSCINLGKRYAAGPGYQGVYVSGRDQGVLVNVYRDGTGGSPYAELVVDPLITDTVPAVARGKSVIAAGTTREEITLLLPMIQSPAAPGLLTPGKLIEVEDTTWGTYRALVMSCNIDAEVNGDGAVIARQNVSIERFISA